MESVQAIDPTKEPLRDQFAEIFLESNGHESLYVLSLSDFWAIAIARMLVANELLSSDADLKLFTTRANVSLISALADQSDALGTSLFQEPLGFSASGDIQDSFEAEFGAGTFTKWRESFEAGRLDLCNEIIGISKTE